MYFFPHAAPLPIEVIWAGEGAGALLAVSGLAAVIALVALVLRGQRARVTNPVPMIRLVKSPAELRRAAA